MKKIFFTGVIFCIALAACKRHEVPVKKTYLRNTGINAQNACNNLFFDSAAVDRFIARHGVGDEDADLLRGFYYARNFEFAWFTKYAATEQCRLFWGLLSYNATSLKDSAAFDRMLAKKMPDLTAEDSLWASGRDSFYVETELRLTNAFIRTLAKAVGMVTPALMQEYLPAKKTDVMDDAAALAADSGKAALNDDAARACNLLRNTLNKYLGLAKSGGWQAIGYTGKKYKPGQAAAVIPAIRSRLQFAAGRNTGDTSSIYDTALCAAVKEFETSLGYAPDGVITDSVIKDLDVPVRKRVGQLVINMRRLMWVPLMANGRLIAANIPEYMLHVFENRKKAFDMNVVVGKQGSATVTFTGSLNEIVFSPYWNIPPSIIKKEILPKMQDDSGYLAREKMEVKGYKNGLPVIRQLPGAGNSLGRVKFLFNNSYNIYFHDTPVKELFSRRKRAYSHGCIRLAEPVKMAAYLLDDNKDWTADKIAHAMDSTKETYVPLKKTVPVIITYYTAWGGENGTVNFRDDVYGHDEEAARQLFTKP